MKNTFILITLLLISCLSFAQESNNGKQLWAKSILNEKAPDLTVTEWLSKQPDTKGKFVLVDEIQKQFKDDLVVIGISDETADKIKAMEKPVIEYYCGIDPQGTMKKSLEVKGIPHIILIDPQGIVRWEGFPFLEGHKLTPEVVKNLIQKYK